MAEPDSPDDLVDPDDANLVAPGLKVMTLLFAAMCGSLAVYVGLAWFVAPVLAPPHPPDVIFLVVLGVAGLSALAVAPVIRARVLPPGADQRSSPTARVRRADAKQIAERYFTGSVMTWAPCEAAGVMGLIASFTSGAPIYGTAACIVAALALFTFRPQAAVLRAMLYKAATHG